MTESRRNTIKAGTKIGKGIGALGFLVFGIVPGFYLGNYLTLILLSHLAGGPMASAIILRTLPLGGTMLGIFCTGAVSIALGSAFGATMGYMVDVAAGFARANETPEVRKDLQLTWGTPKGPAA